MSESFEKWAADKDFLFNVKAGEGYINVRHMAREAWQAAEAQAVNQQLLESLEAAIKFIDSHVADPDITQEMRENYSALQRSKPYDAIAAAQENKK